MLRKGFFGPHWVIGTPTNRKSFPWKSHRPAVFLDVRLFNAWKKFQKYAPKWWFIGDLL